MADFKSTYTAVHKTEILGEIDLNLIGVHNILNSLMAVAVGIELDIPFAAIQKGLSDFKGVFRRFEYKGECDGFTVYDDYAHHPTEIEATLKGVKDSTDKRIVAVFQPHLFSRTRDFYKEFGRSFFQSDVLIVTPIFPAREKPIPGITGKMIADAAVQSGHKKVIYIDNNKEIVEIMKHIVKENDIVLTIGAGSIYKYGEELLKK